jgi:SAM-dependent methyltransferase
MTEMIRVHPRSFAGTSNLRKYQTSNPVVRRLIARFLEKLLDEVAQAQPASILDLGCGEGIVAAAILKRMGNVAYRGCDNNPWSIDQARELNPAAEFLCADIFELLPTPEPPDLVLCLEVMEHIEDTDRFLAHLARLTGKRLILSVPWEPFFRLGNLCRGMHVRRLGNHPEHLHCFGKASFGRALSRYFSSVRIETTFPWLFGICGAPREEACLTANGRE